jgi:sigma-B regulation protein RsbU (phosphoserine phosphatase)
VDIAPSSKARHDVRNLLHHVSGYADLLRADAIESKHSDLSEIFLSISSIISSIKENAAEFYQDPPIEESRYAELRSNLLSQLFDLLSLGHSAKRIAKRDERPEFSSDIESILEATSKVVEMTQNSSSAKGGTETGRITVPVEPVDESKRESAIIGLKEIESAKTSRTQISGRILIIDDDATNRQIMSRQLERQGHVVVTADNGRDALKLLKNVPFDMILLDIMMPEMSGFEILKRVKLDEHLREMPIIVISAFDDPVAMASCIEMGAEDYLPRDFDPIILRARIGSIMERARLKKQKDMYIQAIEETQRRLQTELSDAAKYVSSLLPPPIESGSLRVAWSFIPSLSLGGDIFGYHNRPDGKFVLYLIDVSGHGIEAALLSVTIMNMLKYETLPDTNFSDPADVLSSLNSRFRSEDQNNMYFTIWYGVYDEKTRILSYTSGGNSAGVFIAKDGTKTPLKTEGIVIGVDDAYLFSNEEVRIPENSRLYVYSDGIYEIRNKSGEVFGMEEFIDVLSRLPPEAKASDRIEDLIKLVRDLSMTGSFEDDISLVEVSFD